MSVTMATAARNERVMNNIRGRISNLEGKLFMARLEGVDTQQISECLNAAYDTLESLLYVPTKEKKERYGHTDI